MVIAESDDTIAVEGNHYFPRLALKPEYFRSWKGEAIYFNVVVRDETNENAA